MTLVRSAQSLEYVLIPVTFKVAGVAVDPTSDQVALAFLPRLSEPVADTEYFAATWETDTSDPTSPVYSAKLLIGPGTAYVPTAGTQITVWVKVTDNPEVPIMQSTTDILFR